MGTVQLFLTKVKTSQSDGSSVFLTGTETWVKGMWWMALLTLRPHGIWSPNKKTDLIVYPPQWNKNAGAWGSRSHILKSQVCSCNKSSQLPEPPPNEAIATVTNGSCRADGETLLDQVIEVNLRGQHAVFRAKFSLTSANGVFSLCYQSEHFQPFCFSSNTLWPLWVLLFTAGQAKTPSRDQSSRM